MSRRLIRCPQSSSETWQNRKIDIFLYVAYILCILCEPLFRAKVSQHKKIRKQIRYIKNVTVCLHASAVLIYEVKITCPIRLAIKLYTVVGL